MAHFRGVVRGGRGPGVSRLGTAKSGIVVEAQSWAGKVCVRLYRDDETGRDMYVVYQEPHKGAGSHSTIAEGIVGVNREGRD